MASAIFWRMLAMVMAPKDVIRASALWGFRPLVRSLGHPCDGMLAEADLTAREIDDPNLYVPRAGVIKLLEIAAWRLKCPDFGLRLAAFQDLYILGALAFSIGSATNLREAIVAAERHLNYYASAPSISTAQGEAGLEYVVLNLNYEPRESALQMAEHMVCIACRIIRHITANTVQPQVVTFSHQAMASAALYADALGVAPQFSRTHNAIGLRQTDLDAALASSDAKLQALAGVYLDDHPSAAW